MSVMLVCADARHLPLADESVQCVVTSPPYWNKRDYGAPPAAWGGDPACAHDWVAARHYRESGGGARNSREAFSEPGGANAERVKSARWRDDATCRACGAWLGALGLEPTPAMYAAHVVEVFRSVWRVLKRDGVVWLNLGDSYAHGARHAGRNKAGLKHKDLAGAPWRTAFALQDDGWYLRSDNVWSKPNPMPESATDRTTMSHEYVFLLTKSARYYYDGDAIAERLSAASIARYKRAVDNREAFDPARHKHAVGDALVRRAPMEVLTQAAARVVARGTRNKRSVWTVPTASFDGAHFAVMPEAVADVCVRAGSRPGDVVLDPFAGTGTVCRVAVRRGRRAVGCDVNLSYLVMADERTRVQTEFAFA